jgi:hypothetical protein
LLINSFNKKEKKIPKKSNLINLAKNKNLSQNKKIKEKYD